MTATEITEKLDTKPTTNPYICYGCGWESSIERRKPGKFLCNECLKIWEGGKFHLRRGDNE